MNTDYELKTLKQTMERRLKFIELTLIKINVSISNLEIELRKQKNDRSEVMVYHGADPKT